VGNNRSTPALDARATLACLGALAFWALGPNFIRYLTEYLDAWTQNLLRYLVACLFWLPFLAVSIRNGRFDKRTWLRALPAAATNIAMQSLWATAFYYIDPAFMVLLSKTSIIWIVGFSILLFRDERPLLRSGRFWTALALCLTGVIGVLYFKEGFATKETSTGVIIGLACAFMWGLYTVTVRMAFRHTDSRSGFSVISIYTVVGLAVIAALFGDLAQPLRMGPGPWAVVVFSAITCIALAHVLYYAAIRRIGATIPALVILAQPFAVLAVSHIAFGESLTPVQLIFGLILLVGAGLAILSQQHLAGRAEAPPD